jgi:hypothetical protein
MKRAVVLLFPEPLLPCHSPEAVSRLYSEVAFASITWYVSVCCVPDGRGVFVVVSVAYWTHPGRV